MAECGCVVRAYYALRPNATAEKFARLASATAELVEHPAPAGPCTPWVLGLPWTLLDSVPAPPHLRIVVDGSFVAEQHQGASAFAIFDPNTGAILHQWVGRVPLHQCSSSLEPELWALAAAIAAVPRNAELTVWCDNLTAVRWLKRPCILRYSLTGRPLGWTVRVYCLPFSISKSGKTLVSTARRAIFNENSEGNFQPGGQGVRI